MQGSTVALISTSFTFSSAVCMALGWRMIKKGNIIAHRNLMIASVLLATLFFITYISRSIFIGNTDFGGPEYLRSYYYAFLIFHVTLTLISPVLGVITLNHAKKKRFGKHKKIGPWTAKIWFLTAATGILVYLLLFVIYPEGETVNKFKEYLG